MARSCRNCSSEVIDKKALKRCLSCYKVTCGFCRIHDQCIDCWITEAQPAEQAFYNYDKYAQEATA